MHPYRRAIVAISLTVLLPLAASAQSLSDLKEMSPEDRRAAYENLSDEERTAIRDQRRAEYDSMSEEERQAVREKRAGQRDKRWDSMSEEEREAARQKREVRREENRQRWESLSEEERAAIREKNPQRDGQREKGQAGQHGQKDQTGDRK